MIPFIKEFAFRDQVFFILSLTILVSLVLVFLFAISTIYLRLRNMRKAKRWRALEGKWEPIILDYLDGERTVDDVRSQVGEKESLYFLDFTLRFAQRLRGEENEAIDRLAEPYLSLLVKRSVKGDASQRARALRTLSTLGLDRFSDNIIAALDDPSPLVAMIAARALMHEDRPDYAEHVLARLHRFENWSQSYLASILTSVGVNITPALRNTLLDGNTPSRVRAITADALRELYILEAADDAYQVIATEKDRDLLAAALRLLRAVGRPEHLPHIRNLCRSEDFVIRAQALHALGSLGETEDLALLEQGFADESPWVALQSARGLKEAGGKSILLQLISTKHPQSDLARQVLAEGG
ncbi:MAG: HEAT repeat domain-containing protein [Fidelibacterota bacterium]|nr:MAG: HEAT repeat domain-containing protein [Candidatus Neomarinimicrobiota bacterium]